MILPIVVAVDGCSGPVTSAQDLNGCYFAGGPNWLFKISDGKLADRSGKILSTISLSKPARHDSVVVLIPGIRLTETPQKSMVVVQGDTRKLLAAKRQTEVRLVFVDYVGRIDFHRRQCPQ